MAENQEVKKCPIINNKLTRHNDTSPTLGGVWEKKKKSIIKIQKYAIRFFNKDLAKKHYAKERLKYFTIEELRRLEFWFKIELEKSGR
jgi:hypothetical protein